ncbi:MAG: hypothetical protein FJ399_12910 [Verrucomicrobia bacterium]|nr:hypothetical protein [Verrucomicrobiota bacterium]
MLGVVLVARAAGAAPPPELAAALARFRGDPPPGWSYTQMTSAEGKSLVERCDVRRPEFDRWALVAKDGRPPTPEELQEYREGRSRRSRGGTAPKLAEQLDLSTVERIGSSDDRLTFRCAVRPGEARDNTARFLRATIVVHSPSATVERIELASIAPFSPTLGVKILEMRTRLSYSLPVGDAPSLPQQVETRVRGTAFWFKSLDADRSVTYSDYARAGR